MELFTHLATFTNFSFYNFICGSITQKPLVTKYRNQSFEGMGTERNDQPE